MQIQVNGQPHQVTATVSLQQLLLDLGYQNLLVAVAVNKRCVHRGDLAATTVEAGDQIEILAPMAGG
ncbi:MAG: sulfur carrier protein ThiS [Proteobacteria bacterium]|nr:sulfur carrier protein ThiS [Pseudomonadota bacterium]